MRLVRLALAVLPFFVRADVDCDTLSEDCTSLLVLSTQTRSAQDTALLQQSALVARLEEAIDADSLAVAQAAKASKGEEAGGVEKKDQKRSEALSRQRDLLQSSIDAAVTEEAFDTSVAWQLPAPNSFVASSDAERTCSTGAASHTLWTCDEHGLSTHLHGDHPDVEAERVLGAAVSETCAKSELRDQLETRLDCRSIASYLRFADPESGWLDEAYLTYLGGSPMADADGHPSEFVLAMDNLLRSVHMFSERPIVLVVIGDDYELPTSWQRFPNLILYRMHSIMPGMYFNFNKDRAIIGARIKTAIQLDSDQIVASPRMDGMFEATRSHCNAQYPFPIPPVHWMSREGGVGASEYDNKWPFEYAGPRSMRWVHAHPTYTYHALPFFHDILLVKYTSKLWPGSAAKVWDLRADQPTDLPALLSRGVEGRVNTQCVDEPWMYSDEPMLNVHLWKANATRHWCKMDLEPDLYMASSIPSNFYWDKKWYPDGVPLMFYSVHNTKRFPQTLVLLAYLEACIPSAGTGPTCSDLPHTHHAMCDITSPQQMQDAMERDADLFTAAACCCLSPRLTQPIFWQQRYHSDAAQLPENTAGVARGEQMCLGA